MHRPGARWMAVAGLVLASLAMLSGGALGGGVGSMLGGYGLLVGVAALYLFAGMAIQQRAVQRLNALHPNRTAPQRSRLQGRRVF